MPEVLAIGVLLLIAVVWGLCWFFGILARAIDETHGSVGRGIGKYRERRFKSRKARLAEPFDYCAKQAARLARPPVARLLGRQSTRWKGR